MVGAFSHVAFPLASEVKILPAEAPVVTFKVPVSNVVNLPVDADVAPIAVPLIAPPVIAILSAA